MSSIQVISFDAGGTLIEPWPGVGEVYAEVARELGYGSFSPDLLKQQFVAGWKHRTGFSYSRLEWHALVSQSFQGCCEVNDKLFSAIYERFAAACSWRIFPDVLPSLELLRSRGVRLSIVSNWDERLKPLLNELGVDRFFEAIVVSTEVGAHKPDARIFSAASETLKTPSNCILHIGDSPVEDVEGARQAGWQSMLVERGGERGDKALLKLVKTLPF